MLEMRASSHAMRLGLAACCGGSANATSTVKCWGGQGPPNLLSAPALLWGVGSLRDYSSSISPRSSVARASPHRLRRGSDDRHPSLFLASLPVYHHQHHKFHHSRTTALLLNHNKNKSKWDSCSVSKDAAHVRLLCSSPSSSTTTPTTTTGDSTSTTSAPSTSTDPSQHDGVTLSFQQGLPQLTVPLPSRRENCRFSLRPVTHTVNNLVMQLQQEDKGIDRVLVRTTDGVRIASSASIESLLMSDFDLIINDITYRVTVPPQTRITMEEVGDLSDVRQLVNKLYAALNIDEHQVARERELLREIEDIRSQLIPLEKTRAKLSAAAERRTTVLMYAGLGYMALQFGFLARLTWWEYSWDIMEPVTYFVTYGTAIACYAYYVLTRHDFILPEVRDRQWLLTFHRKARKTGLDVQRYNQLKDKLFALEGDLQRLRDPLSLNLPVQHLAKIIEEESAMNSSRNNPLSMIQSQLKSILTRKKSQS